MAQQPSSQPFVVTVIPQTPAAETTIGEVILSSLGIAGMMLALSLVLAGLFALVRLAWRRRYPAEADHLPPVSPFVADARAPRSTPVQ